jgi:signal transduction histidine kinase
LPLLPKDLVQNPLQTADGQAVAGKQLPLLVAWHSARPVEAQFLFPRPEQPAWNVNWTAIPLRGPSGRLLGVVGSVSCSLPTPDARKLAELSHDLRTPLQSLRLLCSLLERVPPDDPEFQATLKSLRTAADRAVQIAMELLEQCRGPVPKTTAATLSWFALEPVLQGLANEQKAVAKNKGLTLNIDFAAAHGWELRSDPTRLGRVLANLLVNAVRYTTSGRVDFKAGWRESPGGRQLVLSVVDTGPGISQDEQDSIFQPFERGRAGRESDSGGSGLGLAVVDRLIDELGFNLEVYSEYGRGSAFHLLVPPALLRPLTPT